MFGDVKQTFSDGPLVAGVATSRKSTGKVSSGSTSDIAASFDPLVSK